MWTLDCNYQVLSPTFPGSSWWTTSVMGLGGVGPVAVKDPTGLGTRICQDVRLVQKVGTGRVGRFWVWIQWLFPPCITLPPSTFSFFSASTFC